MNESKLGLRNAAELLNRLRRKYSKAEAQQSECQHNKTFAEQQSLQRLQSIIRVNTKQNLQPTTNSEHKNPIIEMSQIKETVKQNSFCELLILKNLEETLALYEKDMAILVDNRSCLEQNIELISQKIHKLKEIEQSNQTLRSEQQKAKQYLNQLLREYHDSMQLVFNSQITQQEAYNSLRNKIRIVVKETAEDHRYIGFVNAWNTHVQDCLRDRSIINAKVAQNYKLETEAKSKTKQQTNKAPKVSVPAKERGSRLQEEEFYGVDQPKAKKKLSQSERASLLGDLKSFAKNFKFPNG